MLLADILVLQEQFNRALIYYSQIQNDLPNDLRSQESQFKVARTSYFQGDFPWSLTQLKVLRSAASKLIANDAMELSLTIADHSIEDTTFVALKAFAKAELKQYQNKRAEAISLYDQLLLDHKGDPIEDEALLNQAQLYEVEGRWEKARDNYQVIIDNYGDGILADDAYYRLGLIYQEQLADPQKAKELFEKIIFNHADSIHFVDARRRYRRLRGDENEKAF
jgi:tetratricopeptide (TPR) repeat protein